MASLDSSQRPNTTFDFSEHNLNDLSGFDTAPCQGGNSDMASAYLARILYPPTIRTLFVIPEKERNAWASELILFSATSTL
jgi:hypothetical protein